MGFEPGIIHPTPKRCFRDSLISAHLTLANPRFNQANSITLELLRILRHLDQHPLEHNPIQNYVAEESAKPSSDPNTVSLFQRRYPEMPRPVMGLGQGR